VDITEVYIMEQMRTANTIEARRTEQKSADERWTALTHAHIMEQTLTEDITEVGRTEQTLTPDSTKARGTEQTPTPDSAEHHRSTKNGKNKHEERSIH
jgi:hypothetical protein